MAPRQKTDALLAPELEAIATAAGQRLRAQTEGNPLGEAELHRSVSEAAGRAIGAGVALSAIADAERIAQARTREQLARDVLQGVERAARRKRRRARVRRAGGLTCPGPLALPIGTSRQRRK